MARVPCRLIMYLCASGLVLLAPQSVTAAAPQPVQIPDAGSPPADARPTALASADFDGNGMPDLAVAYAGADAGAIVLHRGNVDALFPNAPEAKRRRSEGVLVESAFLPEPRRIDLPFAVGLLGAGDFDNDGHQDLLAATIGESSLHVLRGDGEGGLSLSSDVDLGGRLCAMAVGDVNRADGVPDVVAAVSGAAGSALLVYESPAGVVGSKPESVPLPALPTFLTLARVRGTIYSDIVVAAGDELLIVAGRDRRTPLGDSETTRVARARIYRLALPSPIESFAWGNFVWEPNPREEVAITTTDGRLVFMDLEEEDEAMALKPLGSEHPFAPGTIVLPGRLSGHPTEELLILEPSDRPVRTLGGLRRSDVQDGDEEPSRAELAGLGRWSYPGVKGRPLAVLPMRLNTDARPDLVLLQEGAPAPTLAVTSPQAVITVNTSSDLSTSGDGSCSLREAIDNANANSDTTGGDCPAGAGLDTIAFAIGAPGSFATIAIAGSGLPIVTDSVSIDGSTQGCAAPPCVELNGAAAGASIGLRLSGGAGANTVRGLVINRFGSHGIYGTTSGNIIEGSRIGTDQTGMLDRGNGAAGIRLDTSGAKLNRIGGTVDAARNLVSGNGANGISLFSGANTNEALGNHVGIDAIGTGAIPNGLMGIELDGATLNDVGGTAPGARNVISGNGREGVLLDAASSGNVVLGNYIGLDVSGAVSIGNSWNGVLIQNAPSNTVGGEAPGAGNVISASVLYNGVMIATSDGTVVQGNLIGTDASGTAALGNGNEGVRVAASNRCTIGGTTPAAGNLISGNGADGVGLDGSSDNAVLGNYIGTDINGMAAVPNRGVGVWVNQGNNNSIGGSTAGAGNVISGNGVGGGYAGIFIQAGSTGTVVQGNLVGTDATGAGALGNAGSGVLFSGAGANLVGGADPGAGNVVAANAFTGVSINSSTGVVVQGNSIGTDATGTSVLGNGFMGVRVLDSTGAQIGGTVAGERNRIVHNGESGVIVHGVSTDSRILGNVIAGNGLLGIELGESDGVTDNDPGDADGGPNGLQNFPLATSAQSSPAGTVVVSGSLDSTPASVFRLEFFSNESCDASLHGEGRRFLGAADVATDGSGTAPFDISLPAPVQAGEVVTATATSATGSTSEFSPCVVASCSVSATFPHSVLASDKTHLAWAGSEDVRWVTGDLAQVGSYSTLADGTLAGASGLDITADQPAAGTGLYYLVRSLICGSWQTALGSEPGRDPSLP